MGPEGRRSKVCVGVGVDYILYFAEALWAFLDCASFGLIFMELPRWEAYF